MAEPLITPVSLPADVASTNATFEGCSKSAEIAASLAFTAIHERAAGFAMGAVAGAAAVFAAAAWLKWGKKK